MHKYLLFLIFFLFSGSIYAKDGGLGLDRSRIIFNEDDSSVSFTAKNNSPKIVALLKAWVDDYYSKEGDAPFFITPPLNRIDPKNNIQFRINKLGNISKLPNDRESIFTINVLAIPPKNGAPSVQIALNTRIKLIYRPKAINRKRDIDNIQERIEIFKDKRKVVIKNPTPYFATLKGVKLNGVTTKEPAYMIKPFSSLSLDGVNIRKVSFSLINDYGGITNTRTVMIAP